MNSGRRVPAEVLEDGTVTCISPDMSEKKEATAHHAETSTGQDCV